MTRQRNKENYTLATELKELKASSADMKLQKTKTRFKK